MRGDQPTPPATMFSSDPVWLATKMFEDLENLVPPHMPPHRFFPDKEALENWRQGGKIPEHLADEFQAWLAATAYRSSQISEAKRRLNSTTWAQATLTAHGHADLAAHLAEFHRKCWRIAHVPTDGVDRAQLVEQVVKLLSRGAR